MRKILFVIIVGLKKKILEPPGKNEDPARSSNSQAEGKPTYSCGQRVYFLFNESLTIGTIIGKSEFVNSYHILSNSGISFGYVHSDFFAASEEEFALKDEDDILDLEMFRDL